MLEIIADGSSSVSAFKLYDERTDHCTRARSK